jgi:hypothetical protein
MSKRRRAAVGGQKREGQREDRTSEEETKGD